MEIFIMDKPKGTSGKWSPVFDAQIAKASKKGTWFPMSTQKPKIKVKGKWVEK